MRVSWRLRALIPLLAAAVLLSGQAASARVLFGAYVNPNARWGSEAEARREVRQLEEALGRKLAINQRFYSFRNTFPTRLERWDINNGRIPMITWEPRKVQLRSLIAGEYDTMLRRRAIGLRRLDARVLLRFAHEMNGDWYRWSGKPEAYKRAWRHVVDIFRQEGATNVRFVWAPNWISVPDTTDNHISRYYPGDDYVHWVGVSGFNDGRVEWRSFARMFRGLYNVYASRKPFIITETASREEGGSKADWIRKARRQMVRHWPRVRAFVWHHLGKWRFDTSRSAMRAARDMARAPYFRARG